MNTSRQIKPDLFYIGASDRRLALFENMMPVPRGVSYNSYVLLDEKTVLLDTADNAVGAQFLENLQAVLAGRPLDYIIIHHVEPDHLALLEEVLLRHPQATVVCSAMAAKFIQQFFPTGLNVKTQAIKEGETLCTGKHTFTFVSAQMVHWPEVMVSFESEYHILFSADAFGTFGALGGNLYADEVNFDRDWLNEARRYYTNIVGKYGLQVQNLLKKAAGLDIQMICPLHGPIWRENLSYFIEKHDLWSRYEPEEKSAIVLYGSMYGHTESAATVVANKLGEKGFRDVRMYDVAATHVSYLVSESFRSHRSGGAHLQRRPVPADGELPAGFEGAFPDRPHLRHCGERHLGTRRRQGDPEDFRGDETQHHRGTHRDPQVRDERGAACQR